MTPDDLEWDIIEPMIIGIKHNGVVVMKISVCEVIESNPRKLVMNHVRECDRTPWLKHWGADDEIIDKLKGIK
jgi:hypothetical protein